MTVIVAVDAMGGDHGPSVTVPGAARFLQSRTDAEIILIGREEALAPALAKTVPRVRTRLRVQAASEVVDMDEPPADALRKKKDSSMRVAVNLVRDGTAHACVSAGNTGALMAIARFVLKTLPGIDRPAIASQLPTRTGQTTVLDLGANVNCTPVGTPGMFTDNAYVHQIDTKPGMLIHLIENNNRWRVVHTDGRPHKKPEDLEPLFNGDETARWEGDTLVIDSISIDERTWIRDGWFHSDQLHVIERLRRPSLNYLEYQFTIEDPKVLTKPWTSAWITLSLGHEDLTENFCTRNENVDELKKLLDIEKKK